MKLDQIADAIDPTKVFAFLPGGGLTRLRPLRSRPALALGLARVASDFAVWPSPLDVPGWTDQPYRRVTNAAYRLGVEEVVSLGAGAQMCRIDASEVAVIAGMQRKPVAERTDKQLMGDAVGIGDSTPTILAAARRTHDAISGVVGGSGPPPAAGDGARAHLRRPALRQRHAALHVTKRKAHQPPTITGRT